MQALCECLEWKLGEFWQVQREPDVKVYLSGWQFPALELKEFASASCRWTFSPGEGLPGRVWTRRRPLWIRDLQNDDNILPRTLTLKTGLRCAFGLPILLGDEVLGVLVLLGDEAREPDRELLEMMTNVGSQIGQFINRTKAEEALRENELRLKLAMDAARIGCWEVELSSGRVEGLNGAATILGLQPNTLRSRMKKLGILIKRAHNHPVAASLNAKTKGSIFKIREI